MQDVVDGLGNAVSEPLGRTRPWMKFIAIVGFIACGLLVLESLFMIFGLSVAPTADQRLPHGAIVLIILLYLLGAVFTYLIPSVLLMRAAQALDGIEQKGSLETLAEASERQRRFWKYCGILMIVGICLTVLFMIGAAIVIPILAAAHLH